MMRIDDAAMPQQSPEQARAEVGRRSAGIRRRRRQWGGGIGSAAVVVAIALLAVTNSPGAEVRTTGEPPAREAEVTDGGSTGAEDEGAGAGAVPDSKDGGSDGRPGAGPSSPRRGASGAPTVTVPRLEGSKQPGSQSSLSPPVVPGARLLSYRTSATYESALDGSGARKLWDGYKEVRWAPDGRWVVFEHDWFIHVRDTGTGESKIAFSSTNDTATGYTDRAYGRDWSGDSRTIAFVREYGDRLSKVRELWTVNVESGALRRLGAAPDAGVGLSVSDDGRIAYGCRVGDADRVCLTDGSGADLGAVPGSDPSTAFNLSPDGRLLAFLAPGSDAYHSVVVVRTDGSQRRTAVHSHVTGPLVWLPDNERLAFNYPPPDGKVDACTGPPPCPDDTGIWSARIDGSDLRPLSTNYKDRLIDIRGVR